VAILGGCDAVQDRIIERGAARAQSQDRSAWLEDDALHVLLCGTGSPLPDPNRAGPCTAIVAGGALYVVDTGAGSTERLQLDRAPLGALEGVFLTHFHSDHIGELGELNLQSWAGGGRSTPLAVYGPPGVQRVVDGFSLAYSLDTGYRIAHHGAEIVPPSGAELVARSFDPGDPAASGAAIVTVLEKGDLTVSAVSVDHSPVTPAVAYRFDYKGRSVVVSGDTGVSPALVRLARGADLLVHEVLVAEVLQTLSRVAQEAGRHRIAKIATDVQDYHATPAEAVGVAREAGVRMIVFSHLVPPLPGLLTRSVFLRGVDDGGEVEVVLGEDGLHFRLPAGSEQIEQEAL
jgi:ribonuclease Z